MPPKRRLADVAPLLQRLLTFGGEKPTGARAEEGSRETVSVVMRDGIRLATDIYLPAAQPAPTIVVRTPYGRDDAKMAAIFMTFVRHGYAVVAQDCRGTGDSEPKVWDYYVYEREDSSDCIDWIAAQPWFDGFLAGCGGSYLAQTQWCMAFHPRMSTIVPEVGGLGIAYHTAHLYMFLDAYARLVGKGADKIASSFDVLERRMLPQTLAGGYFNQPLHAPVADALLERYPLLRSLTPAEGKRWLWTQYCDLPPEQRAGLIKQALAASSVSIAEVEALSGVFGHHVAHDAHMFPSVTPSQRVEALRAPALMITGWYDWGLNDALKTWEFLRSRASDTVRSCSRLLIAPSAHNAPGYHEGIDDHPELQGSFRTPQLVELLLCWYSALREGTTTAWPTVIYYLMGANDWRIASEWPPPESQRLALYLGGRGALLEEVPPQDSPPDTYVYDPDLPTPTVGGSIVSYVYPPGSIDVSEVQRRSDVLSYTTSPLLRSLDVVGPLRMVLYAGSTAVDTDFCVRLSDVFPDGRAIQLQNGMLRARYRNDEPEFLEPGRIYRMEIDLWATANRFERGHCLRVDISSADFPRFDRHSNRGGEPDPPVQAVQTVYHDSRHPSHLIVSVLDEVGA